MKKTLTAAGLVLASATLWLAWPQARADPFPQPLPDSSSMVRVEAMARSSRVRDPLPVDREVLHASTNSSINAPTEGSLLVQVLWQPNGRPAERIGVHVEPLALGDSRLRARWQHTDTSGQAVFENVPQGTVTVRLDRAAAQEVLVEEGRRAELLLELSEGSTVAGRVVNQDGASIPGASIWVSPGGRPDEAKTVGRADAQGRFHLAGFAEDFFLAAYTDGYQTCEPVRPFSKDREGDVILTLMREAAAIFGVVMDERGRPIPGALVRIGTEGHYLVNSNTIYTPLPPIILRTDEQGWYRSDSARAGGEVGVFARAADFVGKRDTISLREEQPTRHDIVLERGSTVLGRVTATTGEPLPNVDIRWQTAGRGEPEWLYASTTSDTDGSYQLSGLPKGSIELSAGGGAHGSVVTSLVLDPEQPRRWDPVFGAGPGIAGRVLDIGGQPMAGMAVVVRRDPDTAHRQDVTDSLGRFRFPDLPDVEHIVSVNHPDNPLPAPLVQKQAVRAGTTDLELVFDLVRHTAKVRLRVLDPGGLPAADTKLRLSNLDAGATADIAPDDVGRFDIAALPIGKYEFKVLSLEHPSIDLGLVDLGPGDVLDLGLRQFVSGGRLHLLVVDADGRVPDYMRLTLLDTSGTEIQTRTRVSGSFESQVLPVGDYQITVSGSVPATTTTASIQAGVVTEKRMQLERLYDVNFVIPRVAREMTEGKSLLFVTAEWADADGAEVAVRSMFFEELNRVSFTQGFLPGHYSVRIETPGGGYAGEAAFEAGPDKPGQVELPLKRR